MHLVSINRKNWLVVVHAKGDFGAHNCFASLISKVESPSKSSPCGSKMQA